MTPRRVVLASGNPGKLSEFSGLADEFHFALEPQSSFDIQSPDETGLTFVENALIKARHAATISGLPSLADDSGLCVDALDGAPGLYSARYAGASATAAENNSRLLADLSNVSADRRRAHFYCVLVYLRSATDPSPLIAEGFWHGRILEVARGEGGFGYDPLFVDPLLGLSAAELPASSKRVISHRGQALSVLRRLLHRLHD